MTTTDHTLQSRLNDAESARDKALAEIEHLTANALQEEANFNQLAARCELLEGESRAWSASMDLRKDEIARLHMVAKLTNRAVQSQGEDVVKLREVDKLDIKNLETLVAVNERLGEELRVWECRHATGLWPCPERAETLKLLKRMEWSDRDAPFMDKGDGFCPECHGSKLNGLPRNQGHREDCELAAQIKKLDS